MSSEGGPAGQGWGSPAILPSSEKSALVAGRRAGLQCLKPRQSVNGIRAPPIVPWDFARAKGWCLNKIPSFGAALGLSATSILSAWGTSQKEMASETHWCPCTLAFLGGCRGQAGCIRRWCLERRKE